MKKGSIKIVNIVAIIVVILFVITAGLIIYLNHSPYNTAFNSVDLKAYLNKNNFNVLKYTDKDKIELILSNDSVNSIVSSAIKNNLNKSTASLKINDIKLDLEENKIYMNGDYLFFKVPLAAKIDFKKIDNQVAIHLDELKLGNKNLSVPKFMYFMFKPMLDFKISLQQFIKLNFLEVQQIDILDKNLKVECLINKKKINNMLSYLDQYIDNEVIELFNQSDVDKLSVQFIKLLNDKEQITEDDFNTIKAVLKDFFGPQNHLLSILTVLDIDGLKDFFDNYDGFVTNEEINYDSVMHKKSHLLLTNKVQFGQAFLKQLENDIQEENNYLLSDNGKLYNVYNGEYITIESINQKHKLFDKEKYEYDLNNIEFYYDIKNEEIVVKYKLNTKQYLIVHDEQYEVISIVEAKQRYPVKLDNKEAKLLNSDDSQRKEIENFIKTLYNKDDIYTRYLKSDGENAFAVVSFQNNFQEINSIVLQKKQNKWDIIKYDGTYRNIVEIAPGFNVKVLPNFIIQDVENSIKRLNIKYGTPDIIKQLKIQKYYPNNSNIKVSFCSYIGKFVYAIMSDGKEYIFKVEQGFYKDVMPKNEAENIWELPELLVIQK